MRILDRIRRALLGPQSLEVREQLHAAMGSAKEASESAVCASKSLTASVDEFKEAAEKMTQVVERRSSENVRRIRPSKSDNRFATAQGVLNLIERHQ